MEGGKCSGIYLSSTYLYKVCLDLVYVCCGTAHDLSCDRKVGWRVSVLEVGPGEGLLAPWYIFVRAFSCLLAFGGPVGSVSTATRPRLSRPACGATVGNLTLPEVEVGTSPEHINAQRHTVKRKCLIYTNFGSYKKSWLLNTRMFNFTIHPSCTTTQCPTM
jgi:hypothetical protein